MKPAEETPLSALALAKLAEEAGLPKGLFSVLTTQNPAPLVEALLTDPRVRKLSFTGSTDVGRKLMHQCADQIKKVSLELGGNAPFIVFDDADLDAAVEGAMASKYRNSGQTCVCANRILVQSSVYEAFLEKLTSAVRALKTGPGHEDGVTQGPLINEDAVQKVERLVLDAVQKGARALTGGKRVSPETLFFEPTVLADITGDMEIARTEIFGPVSAVLPFKDDAEAIRLANNTEYGLAAYFYARDVGRVWRVAEAIEAGMVGVNTGLISTEVAPFGGVKQSGIGREGSKYGLDEYLEKKYVCLSTS